MDTLYVSTLPIILLLISQEHKDFSVFVNLLCYSLTIKMGHFSVFLTSVVCTHANPKEDKNIKLY